MSLDRAERITREDSARAIVIAGIGVGACAALALIIAVNAGNCNARFAVPVLCQSTTGLVAAVTIAALPFLLFGTIRRPLLAMLALYIVFVPINDALLVGRALTITKIVGIAVALSALAIIVKRPAEVRVPYAIFGWAGVVCLMALSTIWGIDPDSSAVALSTIVSAFALMVLLVAVPMAPSDFKTIITATIASGAIVGIIAIVTGQHELSTIRGQVGRLYLTFGSSVEDPNRFGASLLLPVAMTIGAIGQTRGWARIGVLAIAPLPFVGIYLTASRGTTLALIAMAIVGILVSKHRAILSASLGVAVGLVLVIPNEITSRFFSESSNTTTGGAGRLDIWHVAGQVFRNHWFLGTGIGTFPSAYDRNLISARGFALAGRPGEPQFPGWHFAPHSLLVSTATEQGIVGLAIMTVALFLQYRSLRLIGPEHPYPWLRPVFAAAFIGLLIASLFVDVLTTKFSWLLFTEMLLAARLAAQPRIIPRV